MNLREIDYLTEENVQSFFIVVPPMGKKQFRLAVNPSFAVRGLNRLFSSILTQRSAPHFFFSSSSRGGGCSGKLRLSWCSKS
jgi:hypothetical protein